MSDLTDLMLGVGLMFGLALLFSYMTYRNMKSFIVFLTIFSGFVVWGGLVESWVLILMIIILSVVLVFDFKNNNNNGSGEN